MHEFEAPSRKHAPEHGQEICVGSLNRRGSTRTNITRTPIVIAARTAAVSQSRGTPGVLTEAIPKKAPSKKIGASLKAVRLIRIPSSSIVFPAR